MIRGGRECCDECGVPLVGGLGRTLHDELLCPPCYEKKSRSLGWLLTMIAAEGTLVLMGLAALVVAWCIPLPSLIVKAIAFGAALTGLAYLRPHVTGIAKDIFKKRKEPRRPLSHKP